MQVKFIMILKCQGNYLKLKDFQDLELWPVQLKDFSSRISRTLQLTSWQENGMW